MPTPTPKKESWWPTIGAIVLLIIIVVLGAFSYQSYAHNVELSGENAEIKAQVVQISAEKDSLTARVAELTKQVAEMSCDGVWNGESCDPFPVTVTTKVATGTSPFAAVFTIHAKDVNYTIDFGDGSTTTPISTASTCTPKADGFCLLTVQHTYRNTTEADASFEAKVMRGATSVATTPVTVTVKK